jgi:DNA-binding NarL/FixJ family response regulator
MNASRRAELEPLERRVLELMATGLDSRAVSLLLDMPVEQVREYARSAIAKLGARSKMEAIIIVLREGVAVHCGPATATGGATVVYAPAPWV